MESEHRGLQAPARASARFTAATIPITTTTTTIANATATAKLETSVCDALELELDPEDICRLPLVTKKRRGVSVLPKSPGPELDLLVRISQANVTCFRRSSSSFSFSPPSP